DSTSLAGAIASKGVLEAPHRKDSGDRLAARGPGMERRHRCDRRLERVLAVEDLQRTVLREDRQQRAETPVVAEEAGDETVGENPARRREPRAIGKRLS